MCICRTYIYKLDKDSNLAFRLKILQDFHHFTQSNDKWSEVLYPKHFSSSGVNFPHCGFSCREKAGASPQIFHVPTTPPPPPETPASREHSPSLTLSPPAPPLPSPQGNRGSYSLPSPSPDRSVSCSPLEGETSLQPSALPPHAVLPLAPLPATLTLWGLLSDRPA